MYTESGEKRRADTTTRRVEASPPDFARLRLNRPRCLAVHAAAAARRGPTSLWHFAGGGSGLGGLDEWLRDVKKLQRAADKAGAALVKSRVPGVPLHTLVQLAGLPRLSLLAVDVQARRAPRGPRRSRTARDEPPRSHRRRAPAADERACMWRPA